MPRNFQITHEVVRLWSRFDKTFTAALEAADDFESCKKKLWDCAAAQETAEMPERLYLAVDQFLIAAASIRRAQLTGEVSRMGAWSAWAVAEDPIDKVYEGQLMDLSRFVACRARPEIHLSPAHEAASVMYFNGLYEFARRRSAHKEICEAIWGEALTVFYGVMTQAPGHIHAPEVTLGCMMLTWAARESPSRAPVLAEAIEKAVDHPWLNKQFRAVFCMTLATDAGAHSSKPPAHWAQRALDEFSDCLSSLDRAQMMVTVMREGADARKDAEAALEQLAAVRRERSKGKSPIAAIRESAHTTDYVLPYFFRTLMAGAPDLLLKGLQTWYQQSDDGDKLDPNSIAFSMPFGPDGSVYLHGTDRSQLNRDSQAVLVRVTRKMAEFLNTYTTVAGADNSEVPIPKPGRYGFVAQSCHGLLEALRDTYCPLGVEPPNTASCQLILPTEGHPIQATQLTTWGRTWPIASSLSQPRPDRAPKSILLWCGSVHSAEMELTMARAAFESVGAKVHMVSPEISSSSEFLREYQNASYDVFWIASHGDYDHWSPHEVKLHLAPDESTVKLDDLWGQAPSTDGRRLLVLNVCDGARFAEKGMLPRIGLAAGLSCPSQATISHLWPVRPLPSAAFGALLAHHIAIGLPYFDAYCATLKALQRTAREVGAQLESVFGPGFDLVERLMCTDDDFSRIETWGSAAFYQ